MLAKIVVLIAAGGAGAAAAAFMALWLKARAERDAARRETQAAREAARREAAALEGLWKERLAEKDAMLKDWMAAKADALESRFAALAADRLHAGEGLLAEANSKSMEALLRPLKENLSRLENAVKAAEGDRAGLKKSFDEQVGAIGKIATGLARTADALTSNTAYQGRAGEEILAECLRKAGLAEGVEFFLQQTSGLSRPDAEVRDAQNRWIVIDSKVSLTAFVQLAEAKDEDAKRRARADLVASVRSHIQELARRKYHLENAKEHPDREYLGATVMFMPFEAPLAEALRADASLAQFAAERGVVMATPLTLGAFMRLVEMAWQRERENRNQAEIAEAARELAERMNDYLVAFEAVGEAIEKTREKFDEAAKVIIDRPRAQTIAKSLKKLQSLHVRLVGKKGQALKEAKCLGIVES